VAKPALDSLTRTSSLLARLAVVYADPLRMKIVTELYMREMSPKQFFEEFGGGSVSRVARHFERLAEYEWLQLKRTETGGKRRGAVEHFYRATELVVFDEKAWAKLPLSMRSAFSWTTFEQLTERVTAALAAETFNAGPSRHLSWTPFLLDELGWERAAAAVMTVFEAAVEEQLQARLRTAESGEKPTLATIALAAFESPSQPGQQGWTGDASAIPNAVDPCRAIDTNLFFPMQVAKVLDDPEALQILAELNVREMSPKQFQDEFGGTASAVGRRFQKLAKAGWLEMVRKEKGGKRRGATEHFYRALGPAILDSESWSELPNSLKATLTWKTYSQLREKVKEAIGAGTFDVRTDRHLTWSLLLLDRRGWKTVSEAVDLLFETLFLEAKSAELRIAKSGETPIPVTVALAMFESPKDASKAP
jgi:DNA-binding transcriptional ArsR family regulator